MQYYKTNNEDVVVSVNTVNGDGVGNITEEIYTELKKMFFEMPEGKQIRDNGDGTYSYVDKIPTPIDDDLFGDDALNILLGGAV